MKYLKTYESFGDYSIMLSIMDDIRDLLVEFNMGYTVQSFYQEESYLYSGLSEIRLNISYNRKGYSIILDDDIHASLRSVIKLVEMETGYFLRDAVLYSTTSGQPMMDTDLEYLFDNFLGVDISDIQFIFISKDVLNGGIKDSIKEGLSRKYDNDLDLFDPIMDDIRDLLVDFNSGYNIIPKYLDSSVIHNNSSELRLCMLLKKNGHSLSMDDDILNSLRSVVKLVGGETGYILRNIIFNNDFNTIDGGVIRLDRYMGRDISGIQLVFVKYQKYYGYNHLEGKDNGVDNSKGEGLGLFRFIEDDVRDLLVDFAGYAIGSREMSARRVSDNFVLSIASDRKKNSDGDWEKNFHLVTFDLDLIDSIKSMLNLISLEIGYECYYCVMNGGASQSDRRIIDFNDSDDIEDLIGATVERLVFYFEKKGSYV